jgi:AP-1 complex subunit gamma-1
VGSTRADKESLVDLLDGESDNANATETALGSSANTQDLLADIFGDTPSGSSPITSRNPNAAVDDIMSLFGEKEKASTPGTALSTTPSRIEQRVELTPRPSVRPSTPNTNDPQPRASLPIYTAYDRNGLNITLTPKVNPAQPGMIQIMVRFTSTISETLQAVNFQAAVPKVRPVFLGCH